MKKRCYIVGAGDFTNSFRPSEEDFTIAADAGFAYLDRAGITPDVVVGDFDSLGAPPEHQNIMQSPEEKDDTDMMLAVNEALKQGYKTIVIDGALGGRPDHTMANYQILAKIASMGARGILLGHDMSATVVKNGAISFFSKQPISTKTGNSKASEDKKDFISIFCFGSKAEGVNLSGLKYNLEDGTLKSDYPIGVSNEFTDEDADISVVNGMLLILWTGDYYRIK